jgi:hypothetical protein
VEIMSKHHKGKSQQQQRHGGTQTVDAIDRHAEQAERMTENVRVEVDNRPERGRSNTDRKAKARNERRR